MPPARDQTRKFLNFHMNSGSGNLAGWNGGLRPHACILPGVKGRGARQLDRPALGADELADHEGLQVAGGIGVGPADQAVARRARPPRNRPIAWPDRRCLLPQSRFTAHPGSPS